MQTDTTRPNQHSDGERRYPKFVDGSRSSCVIDLVEAQRGMTMTAIAAELNISERHAYRLLRSGLRKLKLVARRRDIAP